MENTIGDTAADFSNANLHLELTGWSWLRDNGNKFHTSVNYLNFSYLFN